MSEERFLESFFEDSIRVRMLSIAPGENLKKMKIPVPSLSFITVYFFFIKEKIDFPHT